MYINQKWSLPLQVWTFWMLLVFTKPRELSPPKRCSDVAFNLAYSIFILVGFSYQRRKTTMLHHHKVLDQNQFSLVKAMRSEAELCFSTTGIWNIISHYYYGIGKTVYRWEPRVQYIPQKHNPEMCALQICVCIEQRKRRKNKKMEASCWR